MYHAVGAPGEPPSRYIVPVQRLKRQLRWLARRGYSVIALEELVRRRREHRFPPARSVVLTFDDGYADNAELALPLLERLGMPATVFVVTRAAANDWSSDESLAGRRLLTATESTGLDGGPLRLGAHSRTHPRLTELDQAAQEEEIAGSRRDLEERLGGPVEAFAYPYGKHDAAVREQAAKAGYAVALTDDQGRNRPSAPDHALRRVEVFGNDSRPKAEKSSRTRSATWQHSSRAAGLPGSRSKARTVGCSILVALDRDGWSSRAASCAIQVRVARFSQRQKSISPARRST